MSVNEATPDPVTLLGEDIFLAQTAVRRYVSKLRGDYCREMRKGKEHFALTHRDKYYEYLDLYERLGGDPDKVEGLGDV